MRRFRKKLLVVSLSLLAMLAINTNSRAEYTTADIVAASFSPSCLDYCFTGVCIKIVCRPICHIVTTPYVEHNLPDLIVSSYNNPGEISWIEARNLIGTPMLATISGLLSALTGFELIDGGYKDVASKTATADEEETQTTNNLKFKEVSVIGNPVIDAVEAVLPDEHFCKSEVDPLFPYFQSEADALTWRLGVPELLYPESWIPGAREIGTLNPPQSWGSVKPRTGWVLQEYDTFAAAVAAQRAIDVTTRSNQPHVYVKAPGVEESDENEDKWGMISPKLEPNYCTAFGKDLFYYIDREAPKADEGYGWIYWAHHECCAGNGFTLETIHATPICFDFPASEPEEQPEEPDEIEPDSEAPIASVAAIGGGFVWKPVSEGDGKLVILLPSDSANVTVALYTTDGQLIEQCRYVGRTNGHRPTYRCSRPGGAYPSPLILKMGNEQLIVNNPGDRIG